MHKDCEEIVNLVNSSIIHRLGKQAEVEELAFFWKMIGDYYRYASEAASSKSLEIKDFLGIRKVLLRHTLKLWISV